MLRQHIYLPGNDLAPELRIHPGKDVGSAFFTDLDRVHSRRAIHRLHGDEVPGGDPVTDEQIVPGDIDDRPLVRGLDVVDGDVAIERIDDDVAVSGLEALGDRRVAILRGHGDAGGLDRRIAVNRQIPTGSVFGRAGGGILAAGDLQIMPGRHHDLAIDLVSGLDGGVLAGDLDIAIGGGQLDYLRLDRTADGQIHGGFIDNCAILGSLAAIDLDIASLGHDLDSVAIRRQIRADFEIASLGGHADRVRSHHRAIPGGQIAPGDVFRLAGGILLTGDPGIPAGGNGDVAFFGSHRALEADILAGGDSDIFLGGGKGARRGGGDIAVLRLEEDALHLDRLRDVDVAIFNDGFQAAAFDCAEVDVQVGVKPQYVGCLDPATVLDAASPGGDQDVFGGGVAGDDIAGIGGDVHPRGQLGFIFAVSADHGILQIDSRLAGDGYGITDELRPARTGVRDIRRHHSGIGGDHHGALAGIQHGVAPQSDIMPGMNPQVLKKRGGCRGDFAGDSDVAMLSGHEGGIRLDFAADIEVVPRLVDDHAISGGGTLAGADFGVAAGFQADLTALALYHNPALNRRIAAGSDLDAAFHAGDIAVDGQILPGSEFNPVLARHAVGVGVSHLVFQIAGLRGHGDAGIAFHIADDADILLGGDADALGVVTLVDDVARDRRRTLLGVYRDRKPRFDRPGGDAAGGGVLHPHEAALGALGAINQQIAVERVDDDVTLFARQRLGGDIAALDDDRAIREGGRLQNHIAGFGGVGDVAALRILPATNVDVALLAGDIDIGVAGSQVQGGDVLPRFHAHAAEGNGVAVEPDAAAVGLVRDPADLAVLAADGARILDSPDADVAVSGAHVDGRRHGVIPAGDFQTAHFDGDVPFGDKIDAAA